jgi:hypothetical protein
LTYDILLEAELYIRALPVSLSDWLDPSAADDPGWILALKERAEPIMEAA